MKGRIQVVIGKPLRHFSNERQVLVVTIQPALPVLLKRT